MLIVGFELSVPNLRWDRICISVRVKAVRPSSWTPFRKRFVVSALASTTTNDYRLAVSHHLTTPSPLKTPLQVRYLAIVFFRNAGSRSCIEKAVSAPHCGGPTKWRLGQKVTFVANYLERVSGRDPLEAEVSPTLAPDDPVSTLQWTIPFPLAAHWVWIDLRPGPLRRPIGRPRWGVSSSASWLGGSGSDSG